MEEKETKQDVLHNFLRSVQKGQENAIEITKRLLEDGKESVTLALRNRQVQPEPPVRAESPARRHVFNYSKGFAQYLKRYGTKGNVVVLADVAEQEIHAVLNEEADKGFEIVKCKPLLHPLLAPWVELMKERIAIMKFAEFLMMHRRAISSPDGKELAYLMSQIRTAVSTTIHKGRGSRAINGVVVHTEIMGEKSDETVELPETITLTLPVYCGLEPEHIEIDIVLDANRDGEVYVTLSSSQLNELRIKAFDAMLEEVRSELKETEAVVTMGTTDYTDWEYYV